MIELFWKRMSLLSLRLIWKMSLQMLSRFFPLTHSWKKTKKLYLECLACLCNKDLVADPLRPTHMQTTHSKAELGDVQVEPGRVDVYEAEQCPKYPWPPLTASTEHVRFSQGAMEAVTQITQTVHQTLRAAWHRRTADIVNNDVRLEQQVKHSQRKQTSLNENTHLCVLASVRPYKYRWVMFYVYCGMYL